MKVCTKCHEMLDESQFRPRKDRSDGLQVWCIPCHDRYVLDREFVKRLDPKYARKIHQIGKRKWKRKKAMLAAASQTTP